jgi:hypothetical protein
MTASLGAGIASERRVRDCSVAVSVLPSRLQGILSSALWAPLLIICINVAKNGSCDCKRWWLHAVSRLQHMQGSVGANISVAYRGKPSIHESCAVERKYYWKTDV